MKERENEKEWLKEYWENIYDEKESGLRRKDWKNIEKERTKECWEGKKKGRLDDRREKIKRIRRRKIKERKKEKRRKIFR